ncbi:diacylglycerol/lipid kinase family protein [Latilactobacillus fuchuensis]|uniref:Diacylglycerol kinase catalytic domain protein n=2 Tax=Latilactobacillus fuchuensis TaxID=164393 RepID=A0A2N9DVS5_9LACO|nr:diacylglycerol kinase family protein [Latilactobacillus fuchuensis]KRL58481.1 diacylglycerol kinase catalytic domain protein [Latilactobacillus fuchuensis DSM 14340 = JCM 11249]MCP8857719.1 diacylglycerol kinase family lipid kinase [Latilactobacillus fuchuensis]SPC38624.1 Diacylglycerol kinase catalytic domain protein [Latilactobacillus fuchuensis]
MATRPDFYIILNKMAGAGQAEQVWPKIESVLNQKQIPFTLHISNYAGHTTQLAFQFAKFKHTDQILMVIGGDGSLNQAINGLKKANNTTIPIAYLPCGSGNDFARGIGLSRDPLTALNQVLGTTEAQLIDLGEYHDAIKEEHRYFANNVGIGFDAAVVSMTNHSNSKIMLNKYHLGSLAYVSSLVKAFIHQDDFETTITIDGQTETFKHTFLATTTNHPYFGGGVPIMPAAVVNDQLLDLVLIEKINSLAFCFLFLMMLFGKHTRFKAVHHYQASQINIQTKTLEFGQMDGEELGSRTFNAQFNVSQQLFWLSDLSPKNKV